MTAVRTALAVLALCLAFTGSALAAGSKAICEKGSGDCCKEKATAMANLSDSDSEEVKQAISAVMGMDSVKRNPEGGLDPSVMAKIKSESSGLAKSISEKKQCCSKAGADCCSGGGKSCCGNGDHKTMANALDGANATMESHCETKNR